MDKLDRPFTFWKTFMKMKKATHRLGGNIYKTHWSDKGFNSTRQSNKNGQKIIWTLN